MTGSPVGVFFAVFLLLFPSFFKPKRAQPVHNACQAKLGVSNTIISIHNRRERTYLPSAIPQRWSSDSNKQKSSISLKMNSCINITGILEKNSRWDGWEQDNDDCYKNGDNDTTRTNALYYKCVASPSGKKYEPKIYFNK